MKKQLLATFCIIASPFLMVSCISSLLQEKAPTFSKEIQFKQPENSFTKINKAVYPAWKNSKTGNVISVVSDCSENSTLTGLHSLITDSIEQAKLIQQQPIIFQQKPALLYLTEGSLDGQSIEIKSISFKRKNCGYVSSLSGKPKSIEIDQKTFDAFNESFSFE